MSQVLQNSISHAPSTTNERNRVLRNTYWLLALSMIPTALGAWIGVTTGIARALTPGMSLIVFLAGAWGLMFAIQKTKDSAAGVFVLLGFTFFMGLMLSRLLSAVLGLSNGASLVMFAFAGTGIIFFAMATLSTVIKRDLSSLGKWLIAGAIIVFVGFLANFFLQSGPLLLALIVISMVVFTAFILYDLKRVRNGEERNYITATLGVYLSLYNVFQNLLALLSIFGGQRE